MSNFYLRGELVKSLIGGYLLIKDVPFLSLESDDIIRLSEFPKHPNLSNMELFVRNRLEEKDFILSDIQIYIDKLPLKRISQNIELLKIDTLRYLKYSVTSPVFIHKILDPNVRIRSAWLIKMLRVDICDLIAKELTMFNGNDRKICSMIYLKNSLEKGMK